uniref:Uncharacterized protein n=1 Tax=Timspurckia oligopyrenoides TaxID=708627 RepID=A0A7S1ESW1_9RHOD|mmetsp:Transcript_5361/g.9418  ORF Transcript_5361/g.9418 Transcript_5361/m.9418 type:complete len:297 (+) Transcript_5361:215-1105(+)
MENNRNDVNDDVISVEVDRASVTPNLSLLVASSEVTTNQRNSQETSFMRISGKSTECFVMDALRDSQNIDANTEIMRLASSQTSFRRSPSQMSGYTRGNSRVSQHSKDIRRRPSTNAFTRPKSTATAGGLKEQKLDINALKEIFAEDFHLIDPEGISGGARESESMVEAISPFTAEVSYSGSLTENGFSSFESRKGNDLLSNSRSTSKVELNESGKGEMKSKASGRNIFKKNPSRSAETENVLFGAATWKNSSSESNGDKKFLGWKFRSVPGSMKTNHMSRLLSNRNTVSDSSSDA